MISTENKDPDLLVGSDEIVFENEYPNTEHLLETSNMDFDFNSLYNANNKATKPKILTKNQRKNRKKIVKASRRKNRH